jgi:hypothetical protein
MPIPLPDPLLPHGCDLLVWVDIILAGAAYSGRLDVGWSGY